MLGSLLFLSIALSWSGVLLTEVESKYDDFPIHGTRSCKQGAADAGRHDSLQAACSVQLLATLA